MISPDRARELHPLASFDDAKVVAYLPSDGYIDPTGVANALAKGAVAAGAEIRRNTRVHAIERAGGRWLVATSKGEIRAEIVVNAAGQWARQVGRLVGVELPIVPLEHHYLITEPLAAVQQLERELPVLRDPDSSYYVREEGGGLLVGPFERNTVAWAVDAIPADFHSSLLEPALERLEESLAGCARRIPVFADAPIRRIVNGPDGYTPDGHCLMGPVPGLEGFYVASGCCVGGLSLSPAAGRALADLILDGKSEPDLASLSVERFRGWAERPVELTATCVERYGRKYLK